jgi:polysaccharide biosynthesis protein PslH
MKSILIVAMDFPYPPGHGSAVDMWTRMLVLKEMGYRVDLLATVKEMPNEDLMQTVREHVGNLWVVLRRRNLGSALSTLPFQVRSRMDLQNVQLDQRHNAIVLESEYVAAFLENPAARHAVVILRVHNEQVGYFRDLAEGAKSWLKKLYYYSESRKFRSFSPRMMRRCDLFWFISESERQEHVRSNPRDKSKSYFVPTQVNPKTLRPFVGGGRTALFIGTLTISHNVDAIAWFVKKVHPLLSELEGYAFQIAGRTTGQPIAALKRLVQQHSNVFLEEDPVALDGLYQNAAVFVNPVICGAGVKIKLIQALQAGMPVVSTSMGIEGTGFVHSTHLLVADTPQDFAACVRKLVVDPTLAGSLVRNAQAFLREKYEMKANMHKTLSRILEANQLIRYRLRELIDSPPVVEASPRSGATPDSQRRNLNTAGL